MEDMAEYWKDNTEIKIMEDMTHSYIGNKKPEIMTGGLELQLKYKYGSASWDKLKNLKGYNPIEPAEYAVANRLVEDLTLKWWALNVLSKHNRIISKVKNIYWRMTHKCGMYTPHSVDKALGIDCVNGT